MSPATLKKGWSLTERRSSSCRKSMPCSSSATSRNRKRSASGIRHEDADARPTKPPQNIDPRLQDVSRSSRADPGTESRFECTKSRLARCRGRRSRFGAEVKSMPQSRCWRASPPRPTAWTPTQRQRLAAFSSVMPEKCSGNYRKGS